MVVVFKPQKQLLEAIKRQRKQLLKEIKSCCNLLTLKTIELEVVKLELGPKPLTKNVMVVFRRQKQILKAIKRLRKQHLKEIKRCCDLLAFLTDERKLAILKDWYTFNR